MKMIKSDVIVDVLRAIRKINLRKFGKESLGVGDIVFDKKNSEYGIIISCHPGSIPDEQTLKSLLGENNKIEIAYYASEESRPSSYNSLGTLILLTITTSDGSRGIKVGSPMFRIRYTNVKYIEKISLSGDEDFKTADSLSDLENHCKNECFLDCSEECSLWKYKSKK